MNFIAQLTRITLIGFYVVTILSLFIPLLADYRNIFLIITVVLLVAHAVEYLVMKARMVNAAPERNDHLLRTLLFGYGHWLPLLKAPAKIVSPH